MFFEAGKFFNMHFGISKLLFIYFRNRFLHLLLLFLTRSPGRCRSARFNPWDGWFARTTWSTFQTCTHTLHHIHVTPHTHYTAYYKNYNYHYSENNCLGSTRRYHLLIELGLYFRISGFRRIYRHIYSNSKGVTWVSEWLRMIIAMGLGELPIAI